MGTIDLHNHSAFSDGTDTPTELVKLAQSLGLEAVAVTDHDSVEGVDEALAAGWENGVEVVPGIEVSSDYRDNNIHILGYYIDHKDPSMRPVLDWVCQERYERNFLVCRKFQADGIDITMEELERTYPDAILGRPHMAELLMRKGYTSSVKEGFEKYVGKGCPYYMPKLRIPMRRAVEVILNAGGVPVLAHPLQYDYPENEVIEMIEYAKSCGIRGIEAYYSEHSPEDQAWVLKMAERYSLAVTGGSDYHGTRKTHIRMGTGMGDLAVPAEILPELKRIANR